MLRSLYTAATGMEAQQTKMDVIANNLANASTTAFKKARAEFEDLLVDQLRAPMAARPEGGNAPSPLEVGLGVRTVATTRNFRQGDPIASGGKYDVAIEGEGFFRVIRPNGELGYTRAGNFQVDSENRLVTANGELVDPEIIVPPEHEDFTVTTDGRVMVRNAGQALPEELGQLEITTFSNPAGLVAVGGNLYLPSAGSGEALHQRPGESGAGGVRHGYLEGSNVEAVEEMIEMITTQRSYELNSKVIQTADQMLQRLTQLR